MMDLDWGAIAHDIFGVLIFAAIVDAVSTYMFHWRIPWDSTTAVCTLLLLAFDAQRGKSAWVELADALTELPNEVEQMKARR